MNYTGQPKLLVSTIDDRPQYTWESLFLRTGLLRIWPVPEGLLLLKFADESYVSVRYSKEIDSDPTFPGRGCSGGYAVKPPSMLRLAPVT